MIHPRNITFKTTVCLLLCLSFFKSFAQTYEVEPVNFNSKDADFGAIRYENGVVFCSSRQQKKLSSDVDTKNFYTDMFLSKLDPSRRFSAPELFSNELAGILNEGPATFSSDFTTIYYSANIVPDKKQKEDKAKEEDQEDNIEEYKLGIFIAQFENGIWVKKGGHPLNTPNSRYDIAHPFFSGDSILYFASNMSGGEGGTDIYYSRLNNGVWSEPINLGPEINTEGNEIFPFMSKNGTFYFSSDGHHEDRDRTDMDVFYSVLKGAGEWDKTRALPEPINTEYNDFAYTEFTNETFGFISSDRDEEQDNIYSFSKSLPQFIECKENQRTVLCYHIEDSEIEALPGLPLVYQWDLGDGTITEGVSVDHCYANHGIYDVKLSIKDTLTNQVFQDVSTSRLEIIEYEQPFILSNDSVVMNYPMVFFSDDSPIKKYKTAKHYWIIDDQYHFVGDTLEYKFTTPGYHNVLCGAVSEPLSNGEVLKSCSYKQIFVLDQETEGFPQMNPDPKVEPVKYIQMRENVTAFVGEERKIETLYRIIITKSLERLTMNNPIFADIDGEIVETRAVDGLYTYSVGVADDVKAIYELQKKLYNKTKKYFKVESFDNSTFAVEYVRKGEYISSKDAEQLNVEFNKLRDIKFEYNSAEIKTESFKNLDYIAAMLMLEEGFELKVNAHTCDLGSHEYNQVLSEKRAQSVVEYFVKKGIPQERFISKGFAETTPLESNATEQGKAANRRVEFIIVFHPTISENEKN